MMASKLVSIIIAGVVIGMIIAHLLWHLMCSLGPKEKHIMQELYKDVEPSFKPVDASAYLTLQAAIDGMTADEEDEDEYYC